MKVQVQEVSPIERRLEIEVEPQVVADELSRAYATLGRQVKIAGFRPGKIPRRILEQRFKDEVEPDVLRRVQLRAFLDAIQTHQVEAVSDPQISAGKLSLDQPYAFSARVEVKPKLVPQGYQGLALKKHETAVTDQQVAEQISRLRETRTEMKPVEGRDVGQDGDLAVIDFTALSDGKEFPGNSGTAITVELKGGELVDANMPQLVGVKVGETKEFDYAFPADYRIEQMKGKTAHFTVTVKELKLKSTPAEDDAFAVTLGVENLEKLKERVKLDLERSEKTKAINDEREETFKALIEKNTFDVPRSMIDRAVQMMMDQAFRAVSRGGVDPSTLGLDLEQFRAEFRPKAELEVRGQLLLEAIAAAEKIEVSDAEVEAKLEQMATESGAALSQVRKAFRGEDEKAGLRNRVREEKTITFLQQQPKV